MFLFVKYFSVPTISKRLMDGETRVTRDNVRRALQSYYEANEQSVDLLIDEASRMITDYHDYQMATRKISKGELYFYF